MTDYTEIVFVLDRSGSMQAVRSDAIGGFNAFLESQKADPGEATFTLALFDHEYETDLTRKGSPALLMIISKGMKHPRS